MTSVASRKRGAVWYPWSMNDVQEKLGELETKGWTIAAVATEIGVHRETVSRWKAGATYPINVMPVILALDGLARRRRVPKRKRYE